MLSPSNVLGSSDPERAKSLACSTIAERAEECRDLLIESADLMHGYNDGGTHWAKLRDLSGRFNIWASNMGVFAALHASLDYRLRDLEDMKELILEHLENMVDGLARCKNPVLQRRDLKLRR